MRIMLTDFIFGCIYVLPAIRAEGSNISLYTRNVINSDYDKYPRHYMLSSPNAIEQLNSFSKVVEPKSTLLFH